MAPGPNMLCTTDAERGRISTTPPPRGAMVRDVNDTLALLVVARALVQSYPMWTDEYGANVEQLAEIVVSALAASGLLAESELHSHAKLAGEAHSA
jgi:hypothetical protein